MSLDWGGKSEPACWSKGGSCMADAPKVWCGPGDSHPLSLAVTAWRAVGWHGGFKRTVLAMIGWYQANVSAGRNLCARPADYNCSAFAVWAINSYGLCLGLTLSLLRMTQPCSISSGLGCSDGPGEGSGNCCGGG